jgi:hypothetical protein
MIEDKDLRVTSQWRTGRTNGRNIYWVPDGADPGSEPRGHDRCIGQLDTPELASEAVRSHNDRLMGW